MNLPYLVRLDPDRPYNWGTAPDDGAITVTPARVAVNRYTFVTPSEMKQRPRRESLVKDILFQETIAAMVGLPGSGKTFTALDLALCIAHGRPWAGKDVSQGPAAYVAAEGTSGLTDRIAAWERAHGVLDSPNCRFLEEAVNLLDAGEVAHLIEALDAFPEPPKLLVIDTLARCFLSGDENSSRDMLIAVDAADRIRRRFRCTVLLIHHPTKSGTGIRGSSALPGALDTWIDVRKKNMSVQMTCEKQKDMAHFAPLSLTLQTVDLSDERTSLVVRPSTPAERQAHAATAVDQAKAPNRADQRRGQVLSVLEGMGAAGATWTDWQEACADADIVLKDGFNKIKKKLVDDGTIVATVVSNKTFWQRAPGATTAESGDDSELDDPEDGDDFRENTDEDQDDDAWDAE